MNKSFIDVSVIVIGKCNALVQNVGLCGQAHVKHKPKQNIYGKCLATQLCDRDSSGQLG